MEPHLSQSIYLGEALLSPDSSAVFHHVDPCARVAYDRSIPSPLWIGTEPLVNSYLG
jgi:hypothetical protein